MANDWTTRLQRAWWRGMTFLTESHDSEHGQRLVVTELPAADEPAVEDLGAKANSYKLSAYFIGPDYDKERDAFLVLLQQSGADWLTHPWLGNVWARAHTWGVHESTDKGGYCTVHVTFAPGGQAPAVPTPDAVDAAEAAVDTMMDAAAFEPEVMSASAMALFMARAQGALAQVRNALALAHLPLTWAMQVMAAVDSAKAMLAEVLALPGEYAAMHRRLAGLFGQSVAGESTAAGGVGSTVGATLGGKGYGVSGSATQQPSFVLAGGLSAATVGGAHASADVSEATRLRVLSALTRSAVLAAREPLTDFYAPAALRNAQADSQMRGVLLVGAALKVALADYTSAQARDTALDTVLPALDVLMDQLPDDVFQAAATARAAVLQALTAQTFDTRVRDVVRALPSTVLAYDMGVDEAALLERNAVRHPLFVQGRVYG